LDDDVVDSSYKGYN